MRLLIEVFLFLVLFAFFSASAIAHGGGLNASGCHNNRKTGGYHCHRSSSKPKPTHRQNSVSNFGPTKRATDSTLQIVETAQYLLNGLGYDAGVPDGILGNRTKVAVIQFQRDQLVLVTGLIDQKLLLDLAQETEIRLRKVG